MSHVSKDVFELPMTLIKSGFGTVEVLSKYWNQIDGPEFVEDFVEQNV